MSRTSRIPCHYASNSTSLPPFAQSPELQSAHTYSEARPPCKSRVVMIPGPGASLRLCQHFERAVAKVSLQTSLLG